MKKFIFLLICFFLGISSSLALSIECPELISPGEEFNVYLEDSNYTGIKVKYDFDTNFVYKGIAKYIKLNNE